MKRRKRKTTKKKTKKLPIILILLILAVVLGGYFLVYRNGAPLKGAMETITKPEKKNRPRSSNRRSARTGRTDRRRTEGRTEKEETYVPRRRPDTPRPAPRKIEKAKDLDAYFAKLKEFSNNHQQ